MADPFVEEAWGVFTGTVGSTAVNAGDLVYFDGTDWELADADDNTKFAEAIATNDFSASDVGVFCLRGIVTDIDAPYTQGDQYYLSATAGETTATRPAVANNLTQVVGFGLSTSQLHMEIRMPHEEMHNLQFPYLEANTSNDVDGDFMGKGLITASDAVGASCMVPQNAVGLEIAYLWWCGTGVALDASDTYTVDVSSGVDDETTTATTDGITAAALTVAANDLNSVDISAAFSTTGIIEAGNILGIDINKAAEGAGGDDPIMLSCQLVFQVV